MRGSETSAVADCEKFFAKSASRPTVSRGFRRRPSLRDHAEGGDADFPIGGRVGGTALADTGGLANALAGVDVAVFSGSARDRKRAGAKTRSRN